MHPPGDIDLTFRPQYWDSAGLLRAPTANVKGTRRRRAIADADRLDAATLDALLADPTETVRAVFSRMHPSLMGGEYLSDTSDGEVEIARVELQSVTGDVFSVRARPDGDQIRYRIADEYEAAFIVEPEVSDRPLTLGELIGLLDGVSSPDDYGEACNGGLVEGFWQYTLDVGEESAEEAAAFATAESAFYPMLGAYYLARGAAWAADRSTR